MATRKVGTAGRFGARYGIKIRRQTASVESNLKQRHRCPRCLHTSVVRVSTGIWECRRCGLKFAGGAYIPSAKKSRIGVEKENLI